MMIQLEKKDMDLQSKTRLELSKKKTDQMDIHFAAILKPAFILFINDTILLTETNDTYSMGKDLFHDKVDESFENLYLLQ